VRGAAEVSRSAQLRARPAPDLGATGTGELCIWVLLYRRKASLPLSSTAAQSCRSAACKVLFKPPLAKGVGGFAGRLKSPCIPLESTVRRQAERYAARQLDRAHHTMQLEAQSRSEREDKAVLQNMVAEFLEKPPKNLWDNE